jgi:hypothetical protein
LETGVTEVREKRGRLDRRDYFIAIAKTSVKRLVRERSPSMGEFRRLKNKRGEIVIAAGHRSLRRVARTDCATAATLGGI